MKKKKFSKKNRIITYVVFALGFILLQAQFTGPTNFIENKLSDLALPAEHFIQAMFGRDKSSYFQNELIIQGVDAQEAFASLANPADVSGDSDKIKEKQFLAKYTLGVSYSLENGKAIMKINRGQKHGVTEDMPVISSKGLIGSVVNVSQNTSKVMLLSDQQMSFPVKNGNTNEFCGYLRGKGYGNNVVLENVPENIILHTGDKVMTVGDSNLPEGLFVGRINEDNVSVELANALASEDVFIVTGMKK